MTITFITWNDNTVELDPAALEWHRHTAIHNSDDALEAIVESAIVADPNGWRGDDGAPIGAFMAYRVVDLQGNELWTSASEVCNRYFRAVRYTDVAANVWGDRNVEGLLRREGKLPQWKRQGAGLPGWYR